MNPYGRYRFDTELVLGTEQLRHLRDPGVRRVSAEFDAEALLRNREFGIVGFAANAPSTTVIFTAGLIASTSASALDGSLGAGIAAQGGSLTVVSSVLRDHLVAGLAVLSARISLGGRGTIVP